MLSLVFLLQVENGEDQVRIQRLLALSQPVSHDITFLNKHGGMSEENKGVPSSFQETDEWLQKGRKNPQIREMLTTISKLEKARDYTDRHILICMT